MGSDGNKMNDGTGFQPSEPMLCANGCGFFGTAATMNLCSKCYRDLRIKEEQAASAKAAVEKLVNQNQTVVSVEPRAGPSTTAAESPAVVVPSAGYEPANQPPANRCASCRKKVGVLGFKCRCGATFCGEHRYPEKHECSFDFKGTGRDAIAKANPVVKADKVDKI
ncbi:hypothetical protein NMG60_11027236 [Bertholletia excelsa]